MDYQQLVNLLTALRSPDNEFRKSAEAQYEALKVEQPALIMQGVSEICATCEDASTVSIGLVLLRKIFNTDPCPYYSVDATVQAKIKSQMLDILGTRLTGAHRSSAAACVSALAAKVFQQKENWPELWESVFNILSNPETSCNLKTVCCEIISSTCAIMTEYFTSHIETIKSSLFSCFQTTSEGHIVLKEAAFDVVLKLSSMGLSQTLAPLVPLMIAVIQDSLNAEDWSSAERLTSCVAEGLTNSSDLFSSCTASLLSGLMQVCSSPQVEKGVRHMAIEALLTYCESDAKAVRKVPDFSSSFFELLFQYTLQPEYSDTWDVSEIQEDEKDLEEDADQVIGSAGLDRLALALGGRKLSTTAQNLFMQNITSADWRHRNGAVLLICYVAEGMSTVLQKMLPSLVSSIIPSITDEVKYVRANAIDCISQLCTDFAPQIELTLHDQILPPVILALRDPIPHVAGSAARCLDAFFDSIFDEEDEGEDEAEDSKIRKMFTPYVERVCVDSVALLQGTTHQFVREAALGALSSLISTCTSLLSPYANDLVTVFQEVLALPDTPDIMDAKCKAIECVTLLACGVGKEIFAPYTRDICEFLGSMSTGGLQTDDPRSRFVFRGWTCMVECLKDDVLPYMNQVMPALMHMMNVDCDAIVEDADVGDDDVDPDDGYERCRIVIPGVGEKVAKFHTSLIEDKELASNIINAMLQELGISLQPYFADIVNGAIKLLAFNLNASIRENGALILGEIIDACDSTNNGDLSAQLSTMAFPGLMAALAEEEDADAMDTLVQVLSKTIHANPGVISNPTMICEKLVGSLTNILKQRDVCSAKAAVEEEEDELDKLEDENSDLETSIHSICDLIGTLLQRASAVFTPVFLQSLLPVISTWLTPEKDDFLVCRGLVILCDFVENSSAFVAGSLAHIVELALLFSTSRTEPELLQSAFYLISLLSEYIGTNHGDGTQFAVHAQQALASYFAVQKDEKYAHCTCNALSAYVSLFQWFPAALHEVSLAVLETITSHLPAKDDDIEARRIHDRVLGWLVNHNQVVFATPGCADALLQRLKAADPEFLSDAAKKELATK